MIFGISYGLMSFLMPTLFPFIFIISVVTQKLSISSRMYWVNTLLILLSVSLSYQIIISIGLNESFLVSILSISAIFNLWFLLLFLLLSVYLIGLFDLNTRLKMVLGIVVSLTLGVKVSLLSLSSAAPILGSLLASRNDHSIEFSDYMKGGGIAICFALLVILIVSRKIAEKLKEKSWSENIPKVLGIYLFVTQIISINNYFNA